VSLSARLAAAAFAIGLIAPATASAQEKGETCATAYEQAQQHVKEHSPLRARAELRLCLAACPTVLARDCASWLTGVEPQVASLRVRVETSSGASARASLTIDDAPASAEGDAVDVDPGEHHVVARDAGGAVAEARVTLAPGQRDVSVRLRFPAPPPIPPAMVPRPSPPPDRTVPFVIGGIGLAALGAGGALGVIGEVQRTDLAQTCAPGCSPKKVDAIRTEWIAGGVVAGAGLLAVATAVVLLASEARAPRSARSLGPTSFVVSF
jgi:hypothetical protein